MNCSVSLNYWIKTRYLFTLNAVCFVTLGDTCLWQGTVRTKGKPEIVLLPQSNFQTTFSGDGPTVPCHIRNQESKWMSPPQAPLPCTSEPPLNSYKSPLARPSPNCSWPGFNASGNWAWGWMICTWTAVSLLHLPYLAIWWPAGVEPCLEHHQPGCHPGTLQCPLPEGWILFFIPLSVGKWH